MIEFICVLFGLMMGVFLSGVVLFFWLKKYLKRPAFDQILDICLKKEVPQVLPSPEASMIGPQIDSIRQQLKELGTMIQAEKQVSELPSQGKAGLYDEIYHAFDSGKTVGEIAHIMNKNTGEVELILNLRKHWE